MNLSKQVPMVIGLGSSHGDDRAGWSVVDCLREQGYPPDLLKYAHHPADLLDYVASELLLTICDASQGVGPVGTVRCWHWPRETLPPVRFRGTHDFPLNHALELVRQMWPEVPEICLWTIEGSAWHPRQTMSPEVVSGVRQVADAIRQRVAPITTVSHR